MRFYASVVNGVESEWAPVMSGVPQGTVLGPLMFSLHVSDIMSDIESEIDSLLMTVFAILKLRISVEDTLKLQKDIESFRHLGKEM